MSLPVLAIPEDTLQLYSIPHPVRIRPYLVGEEKLLLMAQQANTIIDVTAAVKQIIRRCTFNTVNPDTLPTFDIEWLFLQLRLRSVSNIIETTFLCQNQVHKMLNGQRILEETEPCNAPVKVVIDIADIKMVVPEGHTNRIWLEDGKIGVTLKYPTSEISESQDFAETLATHMDTVFTANGEVSEVSEQTPEEVKAWVDTLSLAHIAKIRVFFETMPRLSHTFTFTCPKCGYTEDITLNGLLDFFG